MRKNYIQTIHITLNPGKSLKPHITPVVVFFFIIEGTPEILIDKEIHKVEKNSLIESLKDIPHSIYNNSEKIARILVVVYY